jgi:hypothetical protein
MSCKRRRSGYSTFENITGPSVLIRFPATETVITVLCATLACLMDTYPGLAKLVADPMLTEPDSDWRIGVDLETYNWSRFMVLYSVSEDAFCFLLRTLDASPPSLLCFASAKILCRCCRQWAATCVLRDLTSTLLQQHETVVNPMSPQDEGSGWFKWTVLFLPDCDASTFNDLNMPQAYRHSTPMEVKDVTDGDGDSTRVAIYREARSPPGDIGDDILCVKALVKHYMWQQVPTIKFGDPRYIWFEYALDKTGDPNEFVDGYIHHYGGPVDEQGETFPTDYSFHSIYYNKETGQIAVRYVDWYDSPKRGCCSTSWFER